MVGPLEINGGGGAGQPEAKSGPILDRLATLEPGASVSGKVLVMGKAGQPSLIQILGQDLAVDLPNPPPTGTPIRLQYLGTHAEGPVFLWQSSTPASPAAVLAPLSYTLQWMQRLLPPGAAGATLGGAATVLLPEPSAQAPVLAGALQAGLEQSGVFYEGHLAAWAQGQWSLSRLLQEPQGQHSPRLQQGISNVGATKAAWTARPTEVLATNIYRAVAQMGPTPTQAVPAGLQTVLAQQLPLLHHPVVQWQGALWPGQEFMWTVERRQEDAAQQDAPGSRSTDRADAEWHSHLAVDFPHLGMVEADLRLQGQRLRLHLSHTDNLQIREALPQLQAALEALGLDVQLREHLHHG